MTSPGIFALGLCFFSLAPDVEGQGTASVPLHSRGAPLPLPGRLLVVNSEGGTAHHTIQGAVDAALDGDTVLVESGTYEGFLVGDKDLAVIAESAAVLRFPAPAVIEMRGLSFGKTLVLRGLRPAVGALTLRCEDDEGIVWAEDCVFASPVGDLEGGSFRSCATTILLRSSFSANDGLHEVADGVFALESNLYLYDCRCSGADSYFRLPGSPDGADGGAGVRVENGFVYAAGCALEGGDSHGCLPSAAGNGGPGLRVVGSYAETLDTVLVGGRNCSAPSFAASLVVENGLHVPLSGRAQRFEVSAPVRSGAPVLLRFAGSAGMTPWVLGSSAPGPAFQLGLILGYLFDPEPELLLAGPALDLQGNASLLVGSAPLLGGRRATTVFAQGLFVGVPGVPGTSIAGEPSASIVVDASVPPIHDDCNTNGAEDALETLSGAAEDCNGNGVPDACDIAAGQSEDCDRDGLPDECAVAGPWTTLVPAPSSARFRGPLSMTDGLLAAGVTWSSANEAVLIYERTSGGIWGPVPDAALSSSSFGVREGFGIGLAATADRIVVGAPSNGSFAGFPGLGVAYVFERDPATSSWPPAESAVLLPNSGRGGDAFGTSVGTDGEHAAVGAPGHDGFPGGFDSGAVFVYERGSTGAWALVAKLTADDAAPGLAFGGVLALDGARLVVGSGRAAYVFEVDGSGAWSQTGRLEASDGAGLTGSIALDGDSVLVGAPQGGSLWRSGAVHVFELQGAIWIETAILSPYPPVRQQGFGTELALDGGTLAVPSFGGFPDAMHLFQQESGRWIALPPLPGSFRLTEVALRGGLLAVAQRSDKTLRLLRLFDCNENGSPDWCDLAAGTSLDSDADGIPDECQR